MKQRTRNKALCGTTIILAAAAQAASAISVNVNGSPVRFSGTPPTEIRGSVLVPLRGVFEALGATVNYNPVTKTINAQKGSSTVALTLGQTTATVNGQGQALSQPAQTVGGTTLVPLRFVAQALGASVQWVAQTSTVEIKTLDPHLASLPTAPGTGAVVGQLTGVYANANPQTVTVRVNGQNTSVPLGANTIVLRSAPGQPGTQVALGQLQPGDQVTVQRGADGGAVSVTASYGEVRGTIKSVSGALANGNQIVTLNDGTVVEVIPNVPVTMSGRAVALSDLMPNENVVIRTNPGNKQGFGVAVVTTDNPNPTPPGQFVDTPGQTQNTGQTNTPGQAGAAGIKSFTQSAQGPLKAGDVLTTTLAGTPGAKASFAIPGVVESVAMRETSPGVYTGSYTITKNVSVTGAAVLGRLTVGNVTAPLIQAASTVTIDTAAPKVNEFSPAKGATTETRRPLIYATISDAAGVGVDTDATRVRLDGQDVTGQATVTPAFLNFKPAADLALGAHTVQLTVADRAGNAQTADWSFTVVQNDMVQSFTSSVPAGQSISVGQTIRFTLNAQPGGRATAVLGSIATNIPLGEGSPGVYTGEYTVKAGDSVQDAPASARFEKSGKAVTVALASGLTIAAGGPRVPVITSPGEDTTAGETLTVAGTAAPGATVRVSVNFVSKALGGLFSVNGSAGSKEVTADKNGQWKAEDLSLRTNSLLGQGQDTVFTVSAVSVAANGDVSDPATIKVRRK